MSIFLLFVKPYAFLAHLAAYGLAQNLEGVGLFGFINGIYEPGVPYLLLNYNPAQGVRVITGGILYCLPIFSLMLVRGAFVLGRFSGLLAAFVVFAPGVLSVFGVTISFESYTPEEFVFGAGYLGGLWNSGVIFVLAFVLGWAVVLMVANLFKSQKFKHGYDHAWCLLTLVGCMYLVVASQVKWDERQVSEINGSLEHYLNVFSRGYSLLKEECLPGGRLAGEADICEKVMSVSKMLVRDVEGSNPAVRRYGGAWLKSALMQHDIDKVNLVLCKEHSSQCTVLPDGLALDLNDFDEAKIIPSEAHLQRVKKLYSKLGIYVDKIKAAEEHENLKYFLFCFISFLAGGKAATSSISIVGEGNLKSSSWLYSILRFVSLRFFRCVALIYGGIFVLKNLFLIFYFHALRFLACLGQKGKKVFLLLKKKRWLVFSKISE